MHDTWPLLTRELQEEARRSFSYWSRVFAAGIVVAAFTIAGFTLDLPSSQHGRVLFYYLNLALSLAIWTLVPLLTADSVSREKREGTLGLLFLTPLSPQDVVYGKAAVHGLRGITLVLAALPVVSLPVILGGVGWMPALVMFTYQLSALLLALAAGLIASVRNTEWARSLIQAELWSAGFALILHLLPVLTVRYNVPVLLGALVVGLQVSRSSANSSTGTPPLLSGRIGVLPLSWGADSPDRRSRRESLRLVLAAVVLMALWIWTPCGPIATASLVFAIALRDAVTRLTGTWQRELTCPPEPRWVKIFSESDFWRDFFRWDTSRTLDRNPVAWLQEYSWTARLTKWGWCVLAIVGEFVALAGASFVRQQIWLTGVLVLALAFTASGSFRRERESGALELLLVAPLRPRHLLGGRVWGIWCHFLPAFAVLYSFWIMTPYRPDLISRCWMWLGGCSFFCLPVIGLFFSLQRLNFLLAWLVTCILGLVLPAIVMLMLLPSTQTHFLALGIACAAQAGCALAAALLLHGNLRRRTFALGRAS